MLILGCQPARAHIVDLSDCPYHPLPDSALSRCTVAHCRKCSSSFNMQLGLFSSPSTNHRASLMCVRPPRHRRALSSMCAPQRPYTDASQGASQSHTPRSFPPLGRSVPRVAPRSCACLRRQLLGVGLSGRCVLNGARHVPILQSHACFLNPILKVHCTVPAGVYAGGAAYHHVGLVQKPAYASAKSEWRSTRSSIC
jgi:hypothetical protein